MLCDQKERSKKRNDSFKLSFVKNCSPSLNSRERKKKKKFGRQMKYLNHLFETWKCPFTTPLPFFSNHLFFFLLPPPFSIPFWLLTLVHLHFLLMRKERTLLERNRERKMYPHAGTTF